jgi:hypothetical protein
MINFIYYDNGNFVEEISCNSLDGVFKHIDEKYEKVGVDWRVDVTIRIFQVEIKKLKNQTVINVIGIHNKHSRLIRIDKPESKSWKIELSHNSSMFNPIQSKIHDSTDVTIYVLWEVIRGVIKYDLDEIIKDITFEVEKVKGKPTSKSKLIQFFSNRLNCNKLWKYSDLVQEMDKQGLKLQGRGVEGERPREFRYALGYTWRTNDIDKNVPDGSCIVRSPFPFEPRNERRAVTHNLNKENWSELLNILTDDPVKLRCFVCGLFADETNHTGQITTFQKGHGMAHLEKGNNSESNIIAICRYCNSEQGNIYNLDPATGKKTYNIIPFLQKRNYGEKLKAFKYLKDHLKKEDTST